MEEKRLLPKITVYLWIIRTTIIFLASALFLILLKIYLAAIFLAVLAGIITIYLLLFFKGFFITFSESFFKLEYGIVFRTTRIIPFNKIIYIKVVKTPVLKAFGVSAVMVKTIKGILFLPEFKSDTVKYFREKFEEKNL